ncbi:hypothetical protein M514_03443, partial [Trichuris suis]
LPIWKPPTCGCLKSFCSDAYWKKEHSRGLQYFTTAMGQHFLMFNDMRGAKIVLMKCRHIAIKVVFTNVSLTALREAFVVAEIRSESPTVSNAVSCWQVLSFQCSSTICKARVTAWSLGLCEALPVAIIRKLVYMQYDIENDRLYTVYRNAQARIWGSEQGTFLYNSLALSNV